MGYPATASSTTAGRSSPCSRRTRPSSSKRRPSTSDRALSYSAESLEQQSGVGSTEAKRVGQGVLKLGLAGSPGNVVQVALRVRMLVVNGRRDDLVTKGEGEDASLESPGPSQQVTRHGLRRTHGKFARMFGEGLLDGERLNPVALRG